MAAVAALALVVGGVVAALALTRDTSSDGVLGQAGEEESAGRSAAVEVQVVDVAGRLRATDRQRLTQEVRSVVEKFVTEAYVDGGTGFPGFTERARRLARQDAGVTTGRGLAGEVALRSGTARLSVFSPPPWKPVGVTASVRFVLDAGAGPRPVTVTGRLLLAPAGKGWRIFGYDLARSAVPSGQRKGKS